MITGLSIVSRPFAVASSAMTCGPAPEMLNRISFVPGAASAPAIASRSVHSETSQVPVPGSLVEFTVKVSGTTGSHSENSEVSVPVPPLPVSFVAVAVMTSPTSMGGDPLVWKLPSPKPLESVGTLKAAPSETAPSPKSFGSAASQLSLTKASIRKKLFGTLWSSQWNRTPSPEVAIAESISGKFWRLLAPLSVSGGEPESFNVTPSFSRSIPRC